MNTTPDNYTLHALQQQAELLDEAGRMADALNIYNLILSRNKPDSHTLQNRGRILRLTGNFARAIADFNLAIEMSPDDASLYCDRGACLAHQLSLVNSIDTQTKKESLERIITDYQASVERDPSNTSAWLAGNYRNPATTARLGCRHRQFCVLQVAY